MAKNQTKITTEELINKAVIATRLSCARESKDAFKATEKRLYAYPVILLKIQDDEETLEEIRTYGVHGKSKSITRFMKNGVRLTEDEIRAGVMQDLTATIARDQTEVEKIEKALTIIAADEYKNIIQYKYFEGKSEGQIGDAMGWSEKTIRRHKGRLVARLSVFFYGAGAVD